MQQVQRRADRQIRRTFERAGNYASGDGVVGPRHPGDPERRTRLGVSRARRDANRIARDRWLARMVAATRVVTILGRVGRTDKADVRRQLTGVPQHEKQDENG